MERFEVHTINAGNEDLGVLIFDDGELAIYDDRKTAQRVADGMNYMRQVKGCGLAPHTYTVVKQGVQND